jgi:hypothetical protein
MAENAASKIQIVDDIHGVKSNGYQRKFSTSEKVSINEDLETARNIADEDRNRKKKQVCKAHS